MNDRDQAAAGGDDGDGVGSVEVKVSKAAVYKAVRNILANELGVSKAEVLESIGKLVREVAGRTVEEKTLAYLKDNGLTGPDLQRRVKSAIDRQIDDLKPIVKDVARDLVQEAIRDDIEGVVAGIVADGLKVQIGYSRTARVKVETTKHAWKEWIPIEERTPEEGQQVIAAHGYLWNDGRGVSTAVFQGGKFLAINQAILTKVTHWRRLPEGPG
jgi:hypothetical protein